MKYFFPLLLIPIYVFLNSTKTIEITAKTPPDQVESIHYNSPRPTSTPETNTGLASWYDRSACQGRIYGVDCKTASGQVFDEESNTIACAKRFRLGTHLKLSYLDRSVDVVCGDRGNFERLGRIFDLTPSLFNTLADTNRGIIKVQYEVLDK